MKKQKEIKITILGKPLSVNATYRKTAFAYYMTKEGKAYKESASSQAERQYKGVPLVSELEVTYHYYFGRKGRIDHLNMNKALNDSLEGIVWEDDKLIKISHHYTLFDKENPRIELLIKEI